MAWWYWHKLDVGAWMLGITLALGVAAVILWVAPH
jgi:hypothetical protein